MFPYTLSMAGSLLIMASVTLSSAAAQEKSTLPIGDQPALQRHEPPAAVVCDRSQLTSYKGVVSGYKRTPGSISITVSTDWGTEEDIVINSGIDAFESYFLLFNRPFREQDWPLIEERAGKLRPGVRATAWICLDGETPPIIDWQPGYSSPGRIRPQP